MNQLAPEPAAFSILDVLKGVLRRRILIGVFLIGGIMAGLGVVKVFTPQYQSEARVLIENLATPFDQSNATQLDLRGERVNDQFVASQVAVMDSEDMGQRVLRDLGLVGKGDFEPLAKGMGTAKKILVAGGFSDDLRLMTPEQRAFRVLSGSKTVYPIPGSNVIAVKYSAGDPKTAARLANALAETYVQSTRERDAGANDRAREWLSIQIEALRGKVSEAEAAVEKFRAGAGLIKGQSATLGVQAISELNSQITVAETAAGEAQARADGISRMLETTGSVDASSEVLNAPVIQSLRQQQIAAQRRMSDLSVTYLPNHPRMKAAQQEVESIDRQIRREAIKIVESLQDQAKVAAARAESLRRNLDQLKGREGVALQDEVKLNALEREAAAKRSLLETMLARYADANARQEASLQPGFARIIQTATPAAAPYFPKVGPTILLTTLAGLGMGLGLAFLIEIMALAVPGAAPASPEPVRPARKRLPAWPDPVLVPDFRPPVLDMTPAANSARAPTPPPARSVPQVLASIPSPPSFSEAQVLLGDTLAGQGMAEPMDRIAGAIADLRRVAGVTAFCTTSVGGSHEAAMVSVALSRRLAAGGYKTALLDAVPMRPSVVDFLSLHNGEGLCELVSGASDVTKVVQRDPQSDVKVIRYGIRDEGATSAQIADRMPSILDALGQVFDVVLVHAGEASPNTPGLVHGCGAVLFVAAPNRQRDAAAAATTLAQQGVGHSLFVKFDRGTASQHMQTRHAG